MTTNTQIQNKGSAGTQAYHGDGLLDIYVGIGVMIITAAMMADMPWMAAIFPATFVPLWRDSRKKLTNPRLVRYGIQVGSDQRAMMLIAGTTLAGVLALGLGVVAFLFTANNMVPAWLESRWELILVGGIGGLSLVLMIVTGFVLEGSRRYLAYASLLACLLLLTIALDLSLAIPMFGAGLLLVGGGLITLFKFIREYPL